MNLKLLGKCCAILVVIVLILVNFFGVNFGSPEVSPRLTRGQPYNSFRQYIWGGAGEQQDALFGWNLTYIKNLNGDNYPDLVIGAPSYDGATFNDIGIVYIFYGSANTGFTNINTSQADVTIRGDGLGNKFGWDVGDAGDINNDGINDLIVGAPGATNGMGRAYIFFGGSIPSGIQTAGAIADRVINGEVLGGQYGTSVTGIGDINNDNWGEVLVGAPGVDQAIITYGYKEIMNLYPNIWDDNETSKGIIRFEDGCNNDLGDTNTWGLGAGDDGWDWIHNRYDPTNLYGGHTFRDVGSVYGPWEPDGPDGDGLTWGNRTALQACAGWNLTRDNPDTGGNSVGGSAAWGIEFEITTEMYNYIFKNSTITVGFDYGAFDTELLNPGGMGGGTEEASTIRSRIWNTSGTQFYLGDIVDFYNNIYIFYHTQQGNNPPWGPIYDSFEWDITDIVDKSGDYYWDFGCLLSRTQQNQLGDDEGIWAFFDNITMKITNTKSTIIQGMSGSGFGSAVANIGDINGDGTSDMLIGAPRLGGGYAALIYGREGFKSRESVNIAQIILTGRGDDDQFGYSVSSAGDVDNDNVLDIIIGAPGGDYANIYFGDTLNTPAHLPDMWENYEEQGTPQVEFDSGIRSTGNTPDITGANDGWDSWDGAYGAGGTPGTSTKFNGEDTINPNRIAADDKLIIAIGGAYGNGANPDSGAYGLEFEVTSEMMGALDSGADAVVSYDWEYYNYRLEDGEEVYIRNHIRNGTADIDLGWELDSDSRESEVFWASTQPTGTVVDTFIYDLSECFQSSGWYYFDVGGEVASWDSQWEGGIFRFDNVHLRVNQPPDVRFIGELGTYFGASVGYADKLNFDDYGDIIIGAPYFDSPNGVDSGAVYGFFDKLTTGKVVYAKNAEYLTYGDRAGDNFGWSLSEAVSVDSDEFAEVATSAIYYDSGTATDSGRVYLLSITAVPRIRMVYPVGGETVNGTVAINATVIDPDNNVDNNFGVRFYYSTDPADPQSWTTIGDDNTPTLPDNIYDQSWDTAEIPDGSNYYLKCWVRDLDLNSGENITSAITVDNAHQPSLNIINPTPDEVVNGAVTFKVGARDSDLDKIGGGINTTRGVHFYFSSDQDTWELLGVDNTGVQNQYELTLETMKYPDGKYWLKANATDWDGFEVEDSIGIEINNPDRPPSITLLDPVGKAEVKGTVIVRATAFDFDGDINSSGVTFYISTDMKTWETIGNAPTYELNTTGAPIYTYYWDTTKVRDYWYYLKAFVMDNASLSNESAVSEFLVHNKDMNPPAIELVTPEGGEMVKETQMISAHVRDPEDNIDSHGVDYYYSEDKEQWRFIGTTSKPRILDEEFYDFLWQTTTIPDGEYWLNVSVSDDTQLKSWDVSDEPIFIHNSRMNPPFIKVLSPTRGEHINGTYTIQTSAIDLENNIDTVGVVFMFSSDGEDWNVLSNVPTPTDDDKNIYELAWDTTKHSDGIYWIKAEATDFDGLKGSAVSDYFFIHNNLDNAPVVTLLNPISGEISGTIKMNATAFDLEKNINENGVKFSYSTDKANWQPISNDPSGSPFGDDELYYEITWDTSLVPDNIYWLRAEAEDLTNLIGFDLSDNITVHNKMTNPPKITLKQPLVGLPLDPIQSIIVEVIDFDNDVESVTFLYSSDNVTWELIDSRLKPERGNTYKTVWNTEQIYNGKYYLKIVAKDKMGNQEELTEGPFEVTAGKEKTKTQDEDFLSQSLLWIIIIIIIVVIMILVVVLMAKRSKRREQELIEEVSAELRGAQAMEGEIEPGSGGFPAGFGGAAGEQTYVPASQVPSIPVAGGGEPDDIEHYKDQMDAWRDEGFLVTRLENLYFTDRNMFMNAFPVFKMNVAKLREISAKLDAMDTTGQELEVDSIRAKLYDPDQALAAENEF
ncbi:integrin alpha, partial [[Eubacterium] cellulosolvens]